MNPFKQQLLDERLKLSEILDNCKGCTKPPISSQELGDRLTWCKSNCHIPELLQKQRDTIEDLQKQDRKFRNVVSEIEELSAVQKPMKPTVQKQPKPARRKQPMVTKEPDTIEYTPTKEEYLKLRLDGINRTFIRERNFKMGPAAFDKLLRSWGILVPKDERKALKLFQKQSKGAGKDMVMAANVKEPRKLDEASLPKKSNYLQLRIEGKTREEIRDKHFKLDARTFLDLLDLWGIKYPTAEKKAIEMYKKALGADAVAGAYELSVAKDDGISANEQKDDTADSQSVTEDSVDETFASKFFCQVCDNEINNENSVDGYTCNTCVSAIKESEEQFKRGEYVTLDELKNELQASQSAKDVQDDKCIEDGVKTAVSNQQTVTERAEVEYITLKFPIYNVGTSPTKRIAKILEEAEELTTELEFETGDRTRILHELFDLNQTIFHWIAGDISELVVGSKEERLKVLQSMLEHHNNKHIEKQASYAADRGWEQFA